MSLADYLKTGRRYTVAELVSVTGLSATTIRKLVKTDEKIEEAGFDTKGVRQYQLKHSAVYLGIGIDDLI